MNLMQPEALGFSSQRLNRINHVMQRYVDEGKLAGMITLVARRNEVVHAECFGMAEIASGRPMQMETIFRIYSMTKPITSAALLMLMEEGRCRLQDPIERYAPMFRQMKVLTSGADAAVTLVDAARPITIHDLLTHTAGLSYGFDDNVAVDDLYRRNMWAQMEANPEMPLESMITEIAKLPLAHQPGTRWRYSVATDVVGYLVQAIADMPFGDFLQQRIFAPLGMVDTSFSVPPEKVERFAAVYGPEKEQGLSVVDAPATSRYLHANRPHTGGGGLVSTTGDYLRFAQMLLNQGELDGVRLLGRKTVEAMALNRLPAGLHPFDDPAAGFGLGVSVVLDPGLMPQLGSAGVYGWGGAANTNFWIDPKEELLGILMLQYMPSDTHPVAPDFRNLVYQALVG